MAKSNTAKAEDATESKPKPKPKPIHHATQNKAIENGVKLEEMKSGTGYWATHEESGEKAKGATAKEALDALLEKLNPTEGEEGEEGDEGKVVVKEKYKKLYQPNGGNCGDALAKALTTFRATGPDSFEAVCRENKIAPKQWEGKNKGMQWMCLSNVLRHRIKRKEEVTVDGVVITEL